MSMNKLYFECAAGISGDMAVAALLDLGADREMMEKALESIPEKGFRTEIRRVNKSGLDCCDFNVLLDEEHENRDHDMDYLHGEACHEHGPHAEDHMHEHGHHAEDHMHGHGHHAEDHMHDHHDHGHDHHHGHAHFHRPFSEVRSILEKIDMPEEARALALKIFTILARAEAKAHGMDIDAVQFHEVGAIDSIVDIVSFAVLFSSLGIDGVIIPSLTEGGGTVRCQHGILPVPVPAVVNIAEMCALPLKMSGISGEFVTPTGAAIAGAVRTEGKLPETFVIRKTGLGAGKRTYERPSILRVMLIEDRDFSQLPEQELKEGQMEEAAPEEPSKNTVWKLETNVDDSTGEQLGYCMERLLTAGALDVWFTPIFMKKNRPAYLLSVLCTEEMRETLEQIIFRETTTIGIRRFRAERAVLTRNTRKVDTELGEAEVKIVETADGKRAYPEYESAAELARKSGRSLAEVCDLMKEAGQSTYAPDSQSADASDSQNTYAPDRQNTHMPAGEPRRKRVLTRKPL